VRAVRPMSGCVLSGTSAARRYGIEVEDAHMWIATPPPAVLRDQLLIAEARR
jgi:hypothetical protein